MKAARLLRLVLLVVSLVAGTCSLFAGTFRDDFEKEEDFASDTKEYWGGVWGGDLSVFKWDNGSIKVIDVGLLDLMTLSTEQYATLNLQDDFGFILLTGPLEMKNYTVECKMKVSFLKADRYFTGVGVMLHSLGRYGAKRITIGFDKDWARIVSVSEYPPRTLSMEPFKLKLEEWYALKAVVQGNTYELFVNGKSLIKVEDSLLPAGMAGFWASPGTEVSFDDFVLTGPEVPDGGHWNPAAHK